MLQRALHVSHARRPMPLWASGLSIPEREPGEGCVMMIIHERGEGPLATADVDELTFDEAS